MRRRVVLVFLVVALGACLHDDEGCDKETMNVMSPSGVCDVSDVWTGSPFNIERQRCQLACELINRSAEAEADQTCRELDALLTRVTPRQRAREVCGACP